jgi:N-formylglutamate amidohydrolase
MIRLRYFITVLAISLVGLGVVAADEPRNLLIESARGSLPIIVAAPHGGLDDIPGLAPRVDVTAERFVTGVDANTAELARRLVHEIRRELHGEPYFVIATFRRRYIDVNRSPEHAYEDPKAKRYYEAYHDQLAEYCRQVQNKFGGGLFIDVHGQAVEVDKLLVGTVGGETCKLLRQRRGDSALVGRDGLLGCLNMIGFVTAPEIDAKVLELPRYNGGYTVQTYGSHRSPGIDAVQFEYGTNYRKPERLDDSARRTAAAVAKFYRLHLSRTQTAPGE